MSKRRRNEEKMKTTLTSKPFHLMETLIHIIGWGIVFGFPFIMMSRSRFSITWHDYLMHSGLVHLSFLLVFYLNYFILIPNFLFERQPGKYIALNLMLLILAAVTIHFGQELIVQFAEANRQTQRHPPVGPPKWLFFLRDIFSMILTIGLSVGICLSKRWMQIEAGRKEAEKNRAEAELKNLRNQLNPHFLLNTLSNIYALISFNSEKAKTAVQELSKLLRYVLYDNQHEWVLLTKEIDFIRNYIELMRIRLTDQVKVETQFDISPDSQTLIAPLIFISLIENAFKHGVSATQPSFIHIYFQEKEDTLYCAITNSYHPKTESDKSGSGIGLELVKKRLELTYSGRFRWETGVQKDSTTYYSYLQIITKQDETQLPDH